MSRTISAASSLQLVLFAFASILPMTASQTRQTDVEWTGQILSYEAFNVHTFEVFAGANELEIKVRARKLAGFPRLGLWLRQGSVPTSNQHQLHATIKRFDRTGKHQALLRVQNPVEGLWYLAVSFLSGPGDFRIERNEHRFVSNQADAEYTVNVHTEGCERGRFGWPKCDQNWMRLSWGAEALFHGELVPGGGRWACSMYEVAPYTSRVGFSLVSSQKKQVGMMSPQLYIRYHGYPTISQHDATTAVGGSTWVPSVGIDLPKAGTWYVCVHSQQEVARKEEVQVSVSAQVLPHTECVERNVVSKNGQSIKHLTYCEDEVEKLQVRYHTSSAATKAMSFPVFEPKDAKKVLRISKGSMRYFSFHVDQSLVGFTLSISITAGSDRDEAVAYLRQHSLPQTTKYDLRKEMHKGRLRWPIRFPPSGPWYLGLYAASPMQFTMRVEVEPCPDECSSRGQCVLRNEGRGLTVGQCSCNYGYSGSSCEKAAEDVSAMKYYGSMLVAMLSPMLAVAPSMYCLYLERYIESLLFLVTSAAGIARVLSDLFGFSLGGYSVSSIDNGMVVNIVVICVISAAGFNSEQGPAIMFAVTCVNFLLDAWFPLWSSIPEMSLCAVALCLPVLALRRRLSKKPDGRSGLQEEGLLQDLHVIWFFLAVAFSVLAYIVASNVNNGSFILLHAVWRILLYLSAWSFLVSCSATTAADDAPGTERLLGSEFVSYEGANGI